MRKVVLLMIAVLFSVTIFSQLASDKVNLQRVTAKEIGNNTRAGDIVILNIKRKMTSVSWNAQVNGECYEADADDMVRNVLLVKIDCSKIPTTAPNNGETIGNKRTNNDNSYDSDGCIRGKKLKKIGLGLSIGGGASTLIGIIMVAAGVVNRDAAIQGGGAAFIALGLPGIGIGVPLTIIGAKRAKEACGNSASLNINAGNNGIGLALKF
ncbi:MAG TPA: hypothetical protein PLM55_01205 [Chitinophagales bacterium]|nr:hypothetical protein [Chitinophagales bacterium]